MNHQSRKRCYLINVYVFLKFPSLTILNCFRNQQYEAFLECYIYDFMRYKSEDFKE